MSEWITLDKPIRGNNIPMLSDLRKVGTLLKIKDRNGYYSVLVGDMNEHGGVCGECCSFQWDDDDLIVAYKVFDIPADEPNS